MVLIAMRWIRFASRICVWLASLLVVVMIAHVFLEVASRLILRRPIPGTIEAVSYFYMVGVTFLPLGMVQLARENITVDLIDNVLPPKGRRFVEAVSVLITFGVVAVVAWASFEMAVRQTGHGEATLVAQYNVLIWPARWLLAAGLVVFFFACLVQFIDLLTGRNTMDDLKAADADHSKNEAL